MLENLPHEHLNCIIKDLTFDLMHAVQKRLDLFGYNKLEEKKVRKAMLNFHIHPFFLFFSLLLAQSPKLIGSSTLLSCFRKQNTKNLGFYVDSFIMGQGSCNYHGHCSCTWRGKFIWLQFFLFFFTLFYSNVRNMIIILSDLKQ